MGWCAPILTTATKTTVTAGFPQDLDLAVATFLLKILDPHLFVGDHPNRASSRATNKAGGFPPELSA